MSDEQCNVYELNQAFVDASEWLDNIILDRATKTRRLWVDRIERGTYGLGGGIVRTKTKFHSGLTDQAALANWDSVQLSRAAGELGVDDPGYDACRVQGDVIDYAFERIQYSGHETHRRTKDICLKDIKNMWEFQQQLQLIFSYLADDTLGVWENYAREMYLKYCADASRIFVMGNNSPDGIPLSTTYNPFTTDNMVIPKAIDVGRLNWRPFEWWHENLSIEAPESAVAMDGSENIWGWVGSQYDFDYMIRNDADIRQDYRDAQPKVMIGGFMEVTKYRGYGLIYDRMAPRFEVKSTDATTITLQRVVPYITEATTVGNKKKINPAYLNAPYGMAIIFLNDVFKMQIPPAGPAAPGGGTQFGVIPAHNGKFEWLNIRDRCENPYGEKGYYASRFEVYNEPGLWSDLPVAYLYKRCVNVPVQLCEPCDVTGAGAITITAATPVIGAGETAAAYTAVEVTLAQCLDCEAPSEVGVDYGGDGGAADATAIIVKDDEAPTYTIMFTTAADWIDAAAIVANTSTLTCS